MQSVAKLDVNGIFKQKFTTRNYCRLEASTVAPDFLSPEKMPESSAAPIMLV